MACCLHRLITPVLVILFFISAEASLFSDCMDMFLSPATTNTRFNRKMDKFMGKAWTPSGEVPTKKLQRKAVKKINSWEKQITNRLISENFATASEDCKLGELGFPLDAEAFSCRYGKLARFIPDGYKVLYNPLMDFSHIRIAVSAGRRELYVSHRLLNLPVDEDSKFSILHELVHIALYNHRQASNQDNWGYEINTDNEALQSLLAPYLGRYAANWSPEEIFANLVIGMLEVDLVCKALKPFSRRYFDGLSKALAYISGHQNMVTPKLLENLKTTPFAEHRDITPTSMVMSFKFDNQSVVLPVPRDKARSFRSYSIADFMETYNQDRMYLTKLEAVFNEWGPSGTKADIESWLAVPSMELTEKLCQSRDSMWALLDESGIEFSHFRSALD